MKIIDCEQRTEAWHKARLGKLTGSVAADMLATIKSGEAAKRRDLRVRLVVERLTGTSQEDTFVNAAMQRGTDLEPAALAAYEALTGNVAWPSGFCEHDELLAGCSLDGQIQEFAGILELKCPKSATHLSYIKAGKVPSDYIPQITHNLWITGAAWCDFVSFDDRFPTALQVVRYRVNAADLDMKAYEATAKLFLAEVDKEVADLQARIGAAA